MLISTNNYSIIGDIIITSSLIHWTHLRPLVERETRSLSMTPCWPSVAESVVMKSKFFSSVTNSAGVFGPDWAPWSGDRVGYTCTCKQGIKWQSKMTWSQYILPPLPSSFHPFLPSSPSPHPRSVISKYPVPKQSLLLLQRLSHDMNSPLLLGDVYVLLCARETQKSNE